MFEEKHRTNRAEQSFFVFIFESSKKNDVLDKKC